MRHKDTCALWNKSRKLWVANRLPWQGNSLRLKNIYNLIAEVKYASQLKNYIIGIAENGVKDIKTSLGFFIQVYDGKPVRKRWT